MPSPATSERSEPPAHQVAGPSPPAATGRDAARASSRVSASPRFSTRGQASVELVVLLPVVLAVLCVGYQGVLAGQAVWEARVAARAAARAHAFGGDPAAAARAHLRPALERELRVTAEDEGEVRVSVRVPTVLGAVRLGRVSATSHFQPQNG